MNRISKNKYNGKEKPKEDNIKDNQNKNEKEVKGKKKKNKKVKLIILSILGILLVSLAIVMGTYIYKADGNIANAAINMVADAVGDETPVTALVLGVSEGIDTPLTDTIILAGYNPKTQASFMLSIPRDTFIGNSEQTAGGYDKINALYQKNVKKTVAAVEKLTGVKIDYYVVVKTSALVQVVDAIGGVEFDVPIDMKYDDPTQNLHIDLKKGIQVLDGAKAEQLLRYRHSNPDSNGRMTTYPASYGSDDFGRMRTQREFIMTTAKQVASWKNISKIKSIVSAVFDNLETDMSMGKIIGYIPSALKLDTESIRAEQLPGESALINSLWFYREDTAKAKALITELMESLGLSEKELNKKYTPIKVTSRPKPVDDNTIKQDSSLTVCDHDWKLIINLEPTCVDKGARNYECSKCKATKEEVLDPIGHDFKEDKSLRVEPTENSEGKATYKCQRERCNEIKIETLPKLQKTNTNTSTDTNTTEAQQTQEPSGGNTIEPQQPVVEDPKQEDPGPSTDPTEPEQPASQDPGNEEQQ